MIQPHPLASYPSSSRFALRRARSQAALQRSLSVASTSSQAQLISLLVIAHCFFETRTAMSWKSTQRSSHGPAAVGLAKSFHTAMLPTFSLNADALRRL